jgi:hypothetical protein
MSILLGAFMFTGFSVVGSDEVTKRGFSWRGVFHLKEMETIEFFSQKDNTNVQGYLRA